MWKDNDYYSKRDDDSAIGDSANNSAEEESGNPSRKSSDDDSTFDPHNQLSTKLGLKIPNCLLKNEDKQQTYLNAQASYRNNFQNRVNNCSSSTSPSKRSSESRRGSRKKSETDLQNKLHTLLSEMKSLRELDRDILRKFVTLNDCIEEVRWRLAENEAKFQRKLAEDDEDFFSTLTESRLGDWDEFEKTPAKEEIQKKTTATPTAAVLSTLPTYLETSQNGSAISSALPTYVETSQNGSALSLTSPTYVESSQNGSAISPKSPTYVETSQNGSAISSALPTYVETSQNGSAISYALPTYVETSQNGSALSLTSPTYVESSQNGSAISPKSPTYVETSQNGFALSLTSPSYVKTSQNGSAISPKSPTYVDTSQNDSALSAISSSYTNNSRNTSAISPTSPNYTKTCRNISDSSSVNSKSTEVKQPRLKELSRTKPASVIASAQSNKTSVDANASEEAEKEQNKTKTNELEKVKDKNDYRIKSPNYGPSDVRVSREKEKVRQQQVSRRTSWRDGATTSTRRLSNSTPKSASVLAKQYNDLITQQKSSTLKTSPSVRSPTEDKAKAIPRRTQWPILEKQGAVKVSEFQKQREYQNLIGLSRVRNIGQVFQATNESAVTKASDSSGSLNSMSSDSSSSLTSPSNDLVTRGNSNKWSRVSSRTRSSTVQGTYSYNNNNNNVKGVVIVTSYQNTSTIDALPLCQSSTLVSRDLDVMAVSRKTSSPNSIYNWICQQGDAPCL